MVVLKDDMLVCAQFSVRPVDFFAGIFALPQSADIKIVVDNLLDGYNRPFFFYVGDVGDVAVLFEMPLIRHARRGDIQVGQMVRDFSVAPAIIIKREDFSYDFSGRRVNLESHVLAVGDDVAVRHVANPLCFFLPLSYDVLYFLGRFGDWHLVDKEVQLDLKPVVVGGVVDVVAY